MQNRAEPCCLLHQIIMLGTVARDAHRVAFLKGIGADEMRRHLAGEHHQRDRIHQRIGDAGHGIGGAGAGGDEHHANLAAAARIAFGGMHGGLFMANENMADAILLEQRIINRQHGAAGIAKDHLYPQIGEGLHNNVGAGHFRAHDLYPTQERPQIGDRMLLWEGKWQVNRFLRN